MRRISQQLFFPPEAFFLSAGGWTLFLIQKGSFILALRDICCLCGSLWSTRGSAVSPRGSGGYHAHRTREQTPVRGFGAPPPFQAAEATDADAETHKNAATDNSVTPYVGEIVSRAPEMWDILEIADWFLGRVNSRGVGNWLDRQHRQEWERVSVEEGGDWLVHPMRIEGWIWG